MAKARHGSLGMYGNHGCRCAECRAANAAYQRELMARYKREGGRGEHGTSYRYDTGCRCDACRRAHNEKSRKTKKRLRRLSQKD
jgi:hypothetical protein